MEGHKEPTWLSWGIVEAIHFDQILQHGGFQGIKNEGLIESALGRPVNKWLYEGADIFTLAAAYGFGIAKNHGFEDGNKRTGFLAFYTFLGLNGYDFEAPEPEVVRVMNGVVEGTVSEEQFAVWIQERSFPEK
ncbi:MAG: type II toxin-antitoxin system death-on-curing family toxin [Gemmatimonadota bacterium]